MPNITHFDASKFKTKFACELKDLILQTTLREKSIEDMISFLSMVSLQLNEAINDSKIIESSLNNDRIGVIWGAGIGGLRDISK